MGAILILMQAWRFPNVWTLRDPDAPDDIVQVFIDRLDPHGSFSEAAARQWAAERGYSITETLRREPA